MKLNEIMSQKSVTCTYQSNYNGWSIEGDITDDQEYDLSDTLATITHRYADDDGYNDNGLQAFSSKTNRDIMKAILSVCPGYVVKIKEDSLST